MAEPTIKIRYRGKLIGNNWVYDHAKVVDLPIPFISKSEKEGEVICAPIGEFPYEYGKKLLELSGADGPFELAEEVVDATENGLDYDEIEDVVGEGNVIEPPTIQQRPLNRWGRPILTKEERFLIKRSINRAKLKRGIRRRAMRSDKGVPKPRNQSAIVEVQPQAEQSAVTVEAEG